MHTHCALVLLAECACLTTIKTVHAERFCWSCCPRPAPGFPQSPWTPPPLVRSASLASSVDSTTAKVREGGMGTVCGASQPLMLAG